ncbi:MAG: pseudouridine synthase [Pseudomonadales bacterium]|nr:pseudouridine synthase [Pseudomonadales bacterium]
MAEVILFNKPYGVLSQFSGDDHKATLAAFIPVKNVYAAGRLDKDSEGLLILTDDGKLQAQISDPRYNKSKTYVVQVEGDIDKDAIARLQRGVELKDGMTLPAKVKAISEPELWPRNPPVRFRQKIPTSWIELTLREGRNRQVRRMTAAVGYPTLRLVRTQVADWRLQDLPPGKWRRIKL